MRGYLDGSEEHVEDETVSGGTLYDNFLANVADVRDYLSPLRATSIEAAAHFDDESLDLVFIDAAHDYESVRADIAAWQPKLKSNGILAGHDYSRPWPEVVSAVEEEFGERTSVYGACWYIEAGGRAGPWSPLEISRKIRRQFRRRSGSPPLPSSAA